MTSTPHEPPPVEPAADTAAPATDRYLRLVSDLYRRHRPGELDGMNEQEQAAFLTRKARELSTRVEQLTPGLAGDDPAGETYLQKVGRLTAARQQAVELARSELLPEES